MSYFEIMGILWQVIGLACTILVVSAGLTILIYLAKARYEQKEHDTTKYMDLLIALEKVKLAKSLIEAHDIATGALPGKEKE